MAWQVDAIFRCRANQIMKEVRKLSDQQIEEYTANCPLDGREEYAIPVRHPAQNTAGKDVAAKFPETCALCDIEPEFIDFEIKASETLF
jgi:hypothetical protein